MRRSAWSIFSGWVMLAGLLALIPNSLWAAKAINITATLTPDCPNCATDVGLFGSTGGVYSLFPDAFGAYAPPSVKSQILTHNTVYTLDTMNTLVNGLVGTDTRTVNIHFYSTVEGTGSDNLPACWGGEHDQQQAVNWSIFSDNSVGFSQMAPNTMYPGHSRLNFNVRNGACNTQIYRYYLLWSNLTIVRQSPTVWVVTSAGPCYPADDNCGTASLYGQGGRHGQTVSYGDWRVPFQVTLVQ